MVGQERHGPACALLGCAAAPSSEGVEPPADDRTRPLTVTLTGADRAAKLRHAAARRHALVARLGTRREALAAGLLVVALLVVAAPTRNALQAYINRPSPTRLDTTGDIDSSLAAVATAEPAAATPTPAAVPTSPPATGRSVANHHRSAPTPEPAAPAPPAAPPAPVPVPVGSDHQDISFDEHGDPDTPIVPEPGTTGGTPTTTTPPNAPAPTTPPVVVTPPPSTTPPVTGPPRGDYEIVGDPDAPLVTLPRP